MNKRKILMLAMSLCMVAILAVGGTLAYFQDTDSATNVFTVGNVDIKLKETFDAANAKLIPATGSAQNGTLQNGITKEVSVENLTGSEDAYVRVHIAIPAIVDDGDPTYNAAANTLHFNYDEKSIGEGKWDWSKTADDGKYDGNWNAYTIKEDEIKYNVYVVTYGTALKAGQETPEKAMHQVYLDSKTTNEQIESITKILGNEWKILVKAEGVQAAGFSDAYEALNTAFGTPSSTANPWNNYGKAAD